MKSYYRFHLGTQETNEMLNASRMCLSPRNTNKKMREMTLLIGFS